MLFSSMTFVFVFMPLVMSIYLLSKKEIRNYGSAGGQHHFLRLGRASLPGNYDYDRFSLPMPEPG